MPAVLAGVVVAGVDVGAGERHVGEWSFHPDVTEQAEHRWELHPYRDAADLPIVDGDDLDLPLEEEGHGLLPGNDPQWLVGGVEDQGLFHGGTDQKLCDGDPVLSIPQAGARASWTSVAVSGTYRNRTSRTRPTSTPLPTAAPFSVPASKPKTSASP